MEAQAPPLISVVIPTHRRPDLLMNRSLPSALGQRYDNIEVVVVIDGPDLATEQAVAEAAGRDSRVRSVVLPHNMGGSDARNAGVQAARGEWIAFLDDDDEWLPGKLGAQLSCGLRSPFPFPIISCAWTTKTNEGETENMPRPIFSGESFGDYLLRRPSLRERNHSLPSSTLLAPTELFRRVPFTSGLFKHQDTDWLLWAGEQQGVSLEIVPELQMVYYRETGRFQMSATQDWTRSMVWLKSHRAGGRLSRDAAAGFLVSYLTPLAALTADPVTCLKMLAELLRFFPRPFEVMRFLAIWFFNPALRHRLLTKSSDRVKPMPLSLLKDARANRLEPPVYHSAQGASDQKGQKL